MKNIISVNQFILCLSMKIMPSDTFVHCCDKYGYNFLDLVCFCVKCKNSCALCWYYSCACGCEYDNYNHMNCECDKEYICLDNLYFMCCKEFVIPYTDMLRDNTSIFVPPRNSLFMNEELTRVNNDLNSHKYITGNFCRSLGECIHTLLCPFYVIIYSLILIIFSVVYYCGILCKTCVPFDEIQNVEPQNNDSIEEINK